MSGGVETVKAFITSEAKQADARCQEAEKRITTAARKVASDPTNTRAARALLKAQEERAECMKVACTLYALLGSINWNEL